MSLAVDLNADLGEGGPADEALLALVTSANVACGAHAGDAVTLRRTIAAAAARGVAVGAHPGYADRAHFGRREMDLPAHEVRKLVAAQVDAARAVAHAEGTRLRHVKPHGALYNQAARTEDLAQAVAEAAAAIDVQLVLVGPSASALARAARHRGLRFAAEVFADRTYAADGSLTPRSVPGAFVEDAADALARVLEMLRTGHTTSVDGTRVAVRADTVCVHGDGPHALAFAQALREGLQAAGVELRAFA